MYMIVTSIFQTVEFYVVACFLAAAVIAYAAKPSGRAAARTYLYAGELLEPLEASTPVSDAGIVLMCNSNGSLTIHRFGLQGVRASGAYSIAVKVIGYDVFIEERLTPGAFGDVEMTRAVVTVDALAPEERYHIKYNSSSTGFAAACSLNLRPGNRIERRLTV